MPFRKIPINVPFWSNVEDESRSVIAEERRDVMKDTLGATIRRPGIKDFASGLPNFADGMFYWDETDLVYIVSATNLYSMDINGNIALIGSGLFKGPGNNVSWDKSNDFTLVTEGATKKLFAANGGRIVVYDKATASQLSGANDPFQCTHVVLFDSYCLGNDKGQEKYAESVLFSVVADPINFQGDFFSAENKPDNLVAIKSAWDEVAMFGTESIEPYYNDATSPFSKIPGGNIEDGTRSPWTIKILDNAFFLLNKDRQLIRIDGRQPTVLSAPIDDILDQGGDSVAQKAEGEVITLKKQKLYLLTINERTFVYDVLLKEWVGEWGAWNKTTAKYRAFKARNFLNIKEWGKTICSDKSKGDIYELDFDTYQDDGSEMRSSVITGQVDHNTGREKRSNELRLRLKRGEKEKLTPTDTIPKMLVRWRDNGSKVWSNYRTVDLGFEGDNDFYYSLFQLGSYRSRQYNFVVTDNVPFSIVEVEEDVDLLR